VASLGSRLTPSTPPAGQPRSRTRFVQWRPRVPRVTWCVHCEDSMPRRCRVQAWSMNRLSTSSLSLPLRGQTVVQYGRAVGGVTVNPPMGGIQVLVRVMKNPSRRHKDTSRYDVSFPTQQNYNGFQRSRQGCCSKLVCETMSQQTILQVLFPASSRTRINIDGSQAHYGKYIKNFNLETLPTDWRILSIASIMPTNALVSLLWAAIAATTAASLSSDIKAACSQIYSQVPGKLFYPQDTAYGLENTDYYNIALAALKPACIFQPTAATEVSIAVEVLNKYKDVPFAVKSGGHDPNQGQSSVKGGILIALSKMSFATYDQNQNVAEVGPGGHWLDVVGALYDQNVTVLGGRLGKCSSSATYLQRPAAYNISGIVGVGGLLMQGGLSFFSTQYGLACDVRSTSSSPSLQNLILNHCLRISRNTK
jgi:hypothetical protein